MPAQKRGLALSEQSESKGFTLVELLVVVAIIGVLATIGVTVFTGARSSANDAKIKGDLDAIRKAYEGSFDPITNKYRPLTPSDFNTGAIPKRPDGTAYFSVAGPGSSDGTSLPPGTIYPAGESYKVCTPLSTNTSATCSTSSTNCVCIQAPQGDPAANITLNSTNHPASCDPNGTLGTGLVGYWKMDGNYNDSAGSNHGIGVGEGINTGVGGKFGTAVSLNGSTQYVSVNNATALQVGTQPFSVAFWANLGSGGSVYHILIGKKDSYWNGSGWFFREASNVIMFHLANGLTYDELRYTIPGSIGEWHHVVGVRNGTTASLYVDGVERLTNTSSIYGADLNNSLNLEVGHLAGWGYFNGLIDDARIYNRALSPQEVTALNNGCIP